MKTHFLLLLGVLFSLCPALAQDCTYIAGTSAPQQFSGTCPPAPGGRLVYRSLSNPDPDEEVPFDDLRGVTIILGQNVSLTFRGETLSDALTNFATTFSSGNDVRILGDRTYTNGAGTGPDALSTLNLNLTACPPGATCTLGNPAVLPVELLSFTARPRPAGVELTWATASESNNAGFTVERSADAIYWQTVAHVEGAGTSRESNDYRLTDKFAPVGTSYYRLIQTDYDGTRQSSELVMVDFAGLRTALSPNPASETTRLFAEGTLSVFDLSGRDVTRAVRQLSTEAGQLTLDIRDLAPGMYLVRDGATVRRLIKH